jgi:cytochrome subunit of sulfide dehydrogenase
MAHLKQTARIKHRILATLCMALPAWTVQAQTAPSVADVRLWAASCAACHGTHGKADGAGLYIAGKPAKELYDDLLGYKNGTRPATVMHQHAKGYSDEELRSLANYFSNIK